MTYNPKLGDPKYESQRNLYNLIIEIFDKALLEKEKKLISQKNHSNKNEVIIIDLKIAMCIKEMAKIVKGGYSSLPLKMYDWDPAYEIDKSLLPKTVL